MEKLNKFRAWMLGKPLIVALLFAPFFRPGVLAGPSDYAYIVWKGIAMLCIAGCFFARPRVSALTLVLAGTQLLQAVMTLVRHSHGSLYQWMFPTASIVALCLLVEECVDTDPKALVKGLFVCLGVLCVINLVTVIAYPGGMAYAGRVEYYFMGRDNGHPFFILPLLAATALLGWSGRWPWWVQALLLALFSASVYITWSATGVVAVTVFLLLFAVTSAEQRSDRLAGQRGRVCNICVYYGVVALVFLLLVMLRETDKVGFFIEGVLKKSVDLSGRIVLWNRLAPLIAAHPFFGNGLSWWGEMMELVGEVNCHNLFLQTMYETGLAGVVLDLAALGLLIRPLMGARKSFCGCILAAGVFAFLLELQMEALVFPLPCYTVFMMAYHVDKLAHALEPARES